MPRLDVAGVGALNLDVIAPLTAAARARLAATDEQHKTGEHKTDEHETRGNEAGGAIEPGTEGVVSADLLAAVLAEVEPETVLLGGSAWNTIAALAHLGAGLSLAYAGVAGRPPLPGPPLVDRMRHLGVDTEAVLQDDTTFAGTALSLQHTPERTLLIHPGANDRMAEHLEAGFDPVVRRLAEARCVHVTSLLDPKTPAGLVRVLAAVRHRNPEIVVTYDPGHVWASGRTPELTALAELADHLLVNERELAALGGATGVPLRHGATVHVKRPDGVTVLTRAAHGGPTRADFHAQDRLPDDVIRDSTGAGDVYAAGLLASLATGRPLDAGVRLGLALARHRLLHLGDTGHAGFAAIWAGPGETTTSAPVQKSCP